MVSLTYAVVDGTSWNDTYTRPGVANAANLTCYAFDPHHSQCGGEEISNQARAHANGEISHGFSCRPYNDTSQTLQGQSNHRYYYRRTRHQQEFAYRFNEYNPNDTQKSYPNFTQRIITASASKCFSYSMVGEPRGVSDGNIFYEFSNDTYNGNITIPGQSWAWDGTTHVYGAKNPPAEATAYACGPRCTWVWAHKAAGHGENSTFYKCPITVSPVFNALDGTPALNSTLQVSDGMARLAATSIALQGRPWGKGVWKQYQLCTFGSVWGIPFKQPDEVGAKMAEFAIGTISTMANGNPLVPIDSLVLYLGSHLKVEWYYAIPLLAGVGGAHLALFMLNLYATKSDNYGT